MFIFHALLKNIMCIWYFSVSVVLTTKKRLQCTLQVHDAHKVLCHFIWIEVIVYKPGVSNIWHTGHNPACQAFLSGPRGFPEMSKNDRFVSIRCVFSSSKIRQNSFSAGALPGPSWGSLRRSPRPSSWLGWGGDILSPSMPSASWSGPPTSLKFVHLALRSKRLDTPGINASLVVCSWVMYFVLCVLVLV